MRTQSSFVQVYIKCHCPIFHQTVHIKRKKATTLKTYTEKVKKKQKKTTLFQVMNTNCHISNIKNVTLRKAQ